MARIAAVFLALVLALALGCGGEDPPPGEASPTPSETSPLLGAWEVDTRETSSGVLALVRKLGDDAVTFESDLVRIGSAQLPVRYEVEESRVHIIRTDREFVHEVDLLADGLIRVHFPGGYSVVYHRASSG